MTSFTRKKNPQHKDLSSGKYRPRVVPLKKIEELRKAEEEEYKKEIERLDNDYSNTRGTNR